MKDAQTKGKPKQEVDDGGCWGGFGAAYAGDDNNPRQTNPHHT